MQTRNISKEMIGILVVCFLIAGSIIAFAQEAEPIFIEEPITQTEQILIETEVNYIGEKKIEDKINSIVASSSGLFDEKEALKIVLEDDKIDETHKLLKEISNKLSYQNYLLLEILKK